jgi:hypothetical protein
MMPVTTKLLDADPPLPPWTDDLTLARLWFYQGRSWLTHPEYFKPVEQRTQPPEARTRVRFTGISNSTPILTWSYEEKLRFWRQAQKREQRENRPTATTKREGKTSSRVTTKTYIRFNPNPKKHASNAERQAAYRKRLAVTTKTA